MIDSDEYRTPKIGRPLAQIFSGLLLLGLAIYILFPFIPGMAWSIIAVIAMWPIKVRLDGAFPQTSESVRAGIMTLMVATFLAVAVVPLSLRLSKESAKARDYVTSIADTDVHDLFGQVKTWPYVGDYALALVGDKTNLKEVLIPVIGENRTALLNAISRAARGVADFFFTLIVVLFCSFFLFRGGESFSKEVRTLTANIGGAKAAELLNVAWSTILGVVYGVLCTAFAQGILAGFGYLAAGAPSPMLLGVTTAVASFIPFGAPIIYVPVSIYLILTGPSYVYGFGLLAWGICVVSLADNVLRPLFISSTTDLPLFLSLLGVLGGILAFGLIGIFIGPMVLAVVASLWTWWVEQSKGADLSANSSN